jgi:hypothetical protein
MYLLPLCALMAGYGANFTFTFDVRYLRGPKQFNSELNVSNTDIKRHTERHHWFYYEYCHYVINSKKVPTRWHSCTVFY